MKTWRGTLTGTLWVAGIGMGAFGGPDLAIWSALCVGLGVGMFIALGWWTEQ